MNDRKMYERVKVGQITVEGEVIDETFEWKSLNPQPRCEKCKHNLSDLGDSYVDCEIILSWMGDPYCTPSPPLDFYCSDWELKE